MSEQSTTKHTPGTRGSLLTAAAQWREFAATCSLPSARDLYERTARNLERQAETGIATCVCCNKPFGQGVLHIAKATA